MAMRQWDGGPKAVKADGGGGFLGGAIAGLTSGIATLSLEEFKEEQQRETARIQREALKLMKDEEYNRDRADKITDREEERKYQGLLRAEERGYEAADAEAKRQHEIAMQELKGKDGPDGAGGGAKLTSTDRTSFRNDGAELVGSIAGLAPEQMKDPAAAKDYLRSQDPAIADRLQEYEDLIRGARTYEEAYAYYLELRLDLLQMQKGGGESSGGDDDWAARQEELRQQYGAAPGAGQ